MDNITHTLAGGLIGQMGLKRRSRFAFAACLLGANAPDIDVFAPIAFPVDGIEFHRGPLHGVFAWPFLAAAIVIILWLADRVKPRGRDTLPFRPGPLFAVAFLAVLTHPFLDWLTTYAIALFAPFNWHWYSGDAIFIIDWVYWLLMIGGIAWSAWRWRRHIPSPGRPAQIAGMMMLAYIGFNLAERHGIGGKQFEHRDRIRARPFAQGPRLIPADRARRREADQRKPARQPHHGFRSFCMETQSPLLAARQGRVDSAALQTPVDLVEHVRKGGRREPRDKASAGRETAVRANQMLAARAHDARVMDSPPDCRAERENCAG